MRTSLLRKSALVAVGVVTLLASSGAAFAGETGWFSTQKPGIACRTQNTNTYAFYSELVNGDPSPQGAWCPIESDYNGMNPSNVEVDLDPGWASLQSCHVAEMNGVTSGWVYPANTLTHSSATNLDTLSWSLPAVSGTASEVECSLPSGAHLMRYTARTYQYFDWTSW